MKFYRKLQDSLIFRAAQIAACILLIHSIFLCKSEIAQLTHTSNIFHTPVPYGHITVSGPKYSVDDTKQRACLSSAQYSMRHNGLKLSGLKPHVPTSEDISISKSGILRQDSEKGDFQLHSKSSHWIKSAMIWPSVMLKKKRKALVVILCLLGILSFFLVPLTKPSRQYNGTSDCVARSYDEWTSQKILEHYWGEHIHLGYYSDDERAAGAFRKSFKKAKVDFFYTLLRLSGLESTSPGFVLDVGCGIGGSTRLLSKAFPDAVVMGITISHEQILRARKLKDMQMRNARCFFNYMNADKISFLNETCDVVWVCESTEHMQDKQKVLEEFVRVTKPGGKLVFAVWSQRDDEEKPFSASELKELNYLYNQWCHPAFISVKKFRNLLNQTGEIEEIETFDWTKETLPSWYHNIVLGLIDPLPWIRRPWLLRSLFRDAWCLHKMHCAFKSGLMEYSILIATKKLRKPSSEF